MWVTSESYRIAGKFGGENVWQIYSFQAFGEKKFGEWISQMVINCNYYFGWLLLCMALVWRIADDFPNSLNFLPIKLFCYTVCGSHPDYSVGQ